MMGGKMEGILHLKKHPSHWKYSLHTYLVQMFERCIYYYMTFGLGTMNPKPITHKAQAQTPFVNIYKL
jgi:hypothetical protein